MLKKIVVFIISKRVKIPIIFKNFHQKIFKYWHFRKTIQFPIIFTIKKLFRKMFLKTQKLKFHEEKKSHKPALVPSFFNSEDEELFFKKTCAKL
jgi:hypothetical protein